MMFEIGILLLCMGAFLLMFLIVSFFEEFSLRVVDTITEAIDKFIEWLGRGITE